QVQRAVQSHIQSAFVRELHFARNLNIRVRALERRLLDLQIVSRRTESYRTDVLQLYVRVGYRKMREIRVDDQRSWILEVSVYRTFTFGFAVPLELVQMLSSEQERVKGDVLDRNVPVQRERIEQAERNIPGKFTGAHRRTEFESRGASVAVQFA